MYKSLESADIDYIRSFIPEDRVLTGADINEDFSKDELGGVSKYPDMLIYIKSADEVSKILRYASENLIPVVARGSGTGLVGASVPVFGGIMLCDTMMNKILELDRENLTLTVEPGVLLMEIAAFTEANGLFYPPDPGEKSATIGGNIATNAGGMRAVKYGVTRDYVRGLEAVLPSGEIVEFGGKVVKTSSGYSLKDLIVGSEGTLAVITKAVLKLMPLPGYAISLLLPYPDIKSAVESVVDVMMGRHIPTAVEFMENEVIMDAEKFLGRRFPDKQSEAYLLISYDASTRDELDAACGAAWEICRERGALDMLIVDTDERKDAVWSARGAFLEAIKASTTEMDECDVVVPKSEVAAFIEYTYELKEKYNIRIKSFGHAGDGNLHIYILRDDLGEGDWKLKLEAIFGDLYSRAAEAGGKVSGEHGVGLAKMPYLAKVEPAAALELMRGIKKTFDPNNILNPGKIV